MVSIVVLMVCMELVVIACLVDELLILDNYAAHDDHLVFVEEKRRNERGEGGWKTIRKTKISLSQIDFHPGNERRIGTILRYGKM